MNEKKNFLREYLVKEGINFKHFATRIGISYPTINNILRNHSFPHIKVAGKIEEHTYGKIKITDWLTHETISLKGKRKSNAKSQKPKLRKKE